MDQATLNKPIKDFMVETTKGKMNLSDLKNKNIILYFYPKDNTPGCTKEGQDFRDQFDKFKKLATVIFGVSRDTITCHAGFKSKQSFPFELISDHDEKLCAYFDVVKGKSMFGRKILGIQRSTFLIDKEGILRKEWRKVKVDGHVAEVLEAIKEL